MLEIPGAVDCEHYARKVKGYAVKRQLISEGHGIIKTGYRKDIDPEEALDKAQTRILGIEGNTNGYESQSLSDLAIEASDRLESLQRRGLDVSGITTGYIDLDRSTCGLQNSDLIILAARPINQDLERVLIN